MKWFGESWGAPVCDDAEHAVTPVGSVCLYCETAIAPTSQGVILPSASDDLLTETSFHLDCFLVSLGLNPRTRRTR